MKKTLTYVSAPKTPAGTWRGRRTRLAGTLALLGVMTGLGVFASRPAHTAGGPIAVTVANTPLATTPTDLAAPSQPFQYLFDLGTISGNRVVGTFTVPLHKRLVIEYVSASLTFLSSGIGGSVYLDTVAGGVDVGHPLTNIVRDTNTYSQLVRLYADPGTTVSVIATSNSNSIPGIGTVTEISGYYVNVP